MSFKSLTLSAAAVMALSTSLMAGDVAKMMIDDAYARSSRPNAPSGAAFLTITNHTGEDDRLIEARSDVAERVELHTHRENAEGVMQMLPVEDGFAVPAGGSHVLSRGGDHIMFMGVTDPFEEGATVPVTLVFEKAGEIVVDIPVDLKRKPAAGGHGSHGAGHGDSHSGHGGHSDH